MKFSRLATVANKLAVALIYLTLMISVNAFASEKPAPTTPLWYDSDLSVLHINDHQGASVRPQSGWVSVSPQNPTFFELRSGQVAQLLRQDATNLESVQVHISEGRGLFRAQADISWTDRQQVITNPLNRDVWVMIRSALPVKIKLRTGNQYSLGNRDYWENVGFDVANSIDVKNTESGRASALKPLQKDEDFTYIAERDEKVKLDYYVDFEKLGDLSNVPIHLLWQIDELTPDKSVRYANFNFRTLSQSQCTLALSFKEQIIVDLKRGQSLTFQASHSGFVTTSSNHEGHYLFSRNRASLDVKKVAPLKPSLLNENLSDKWYPLLRAYDLSVPWKLSDKNNTLTKRRELYPQKNDHSVNWLYSVRGRPFKFHGRTLEQTVQSNRLHFSSRYSRTNLNKMVLGRYQRLDSSQSTLTFSLPPNRVLRELELEVATPNASSELISLWVSVDDLPAQEWLLAPGLQAVTGQPSVLSMYLEASLEPPITQPVSYTDAFANLKQRAPMVRTNLAYLPIPDSAKKVTIDIAQQDLRQGEKHWVSLRDFVYKPNLGDVSIVNEPQSKTLTRLSHAFDLFRQQEANFVLTKSINSNDAKIQLEALLQNLEAKPFIEQRDIIQWSGFFQVVRNARQALNQDYVAEASAKQLRRFSDANAPVWGEMQRWLTGSQPSTTLNVIIGLSLHHPNQEVRLRAINILIQQEEGLITINRLEQVLLAYLYQDMEKLETFLPKLLQLWSEQGKYKLIDLLPKPPESAAYYDLLSSVSQRRELDELEQFYDNSSFESDKSKYLHQVARLLHARDTADQSQDEKAQLSYLEGFSFWRANQQAVQQYTQHLTLQHRTRPELNKKVFLVGPDNTLMVKSNELRRYRLKVAPVLTSTSTNDKSGDYGRITIGEDSHLITGISQSNWFADLSENNSINLLSRFSTLFFSRRDQEQAEIKIVASKPMVVYLERMEDPAGLLQTLSAPLETISQDAYKKKTPALSSPLQAYWSLSPKQHNMCGEIEIKNLSQTNHVLPIDISDVQHLTLKSRSSQLLEKHLSKLGEQATRVQSLSFKQANIATSAKHIHWSEIKEYKQRYPDLRATAFQQVRWRELVDVKQHAGIYPVQFEKPIAITQTESQRSELSSELQRDYPFSITGQTARGFTVSSPVDQSGSLNIAARKPLFATTKSVTIWVEIGSSAPQKHTLKTGSIGQITLPLKQGNNVVKLWLDASNLREMVFYDFVFPSSIQAIQASTNRYYLATPSKTIGFNVRGPQRLKVVISNAAGETKVTEQHLSEGLNKLHFEAEGDFKYFRFFVLQENYEKQLQKIDDAQTISTKKGCRNNSECLTRNSILDKTKLEDILAFGFHPSTQQSIYVANNIELENQQSPKPTSPNDKHKKIQTVDIPAPTLGLDFRWVNRDSNDDEPDSTDQLDSAFIQVNGWSRQNRKNGEQVTSLDATLRRFDLANVYRVHARNDWLKSGNSLPFDYALGGELWHQAETDLNPSINSGRLYARSDYDFHATPRISLRTRGTAWYRASDADSETNFSSVDSDVWSEFKSQHKYGIGLAQRMVYRHKLDSEAYAEVNLLSNENPLSADRAGLLLGWRSYFGRASSDISISHRRFGEDRDRETGFDRTDINMSTDWLLPFSSQSNFRLSARAQFNIDENEVSWWLNVGWFNHGGQQLFDFRPDELRFRRPRDWWLRRSTQTDYSAGDF